MSWNQLRQNLINELSNPETIEGYLDKFYGQREDRPMPELFISRCIVKYDKGRKEHNDTYEDFTRKIEQELDQEYLDVAIYEILRAIINENRK